jgi:hypothetical protein
VFARPPTLVRGSRANRKYPKGIEKRPSIEGSSPGTSFRIPAAMPTSRYWSPAALRITSGLPTTYPEPYSQG